MKLLIFTFLLLLCPQVVGQNQTLPFRDEYQFSNGRVTLEMKDKTLKPDKTYLAKYTFYVTNSSYDTYNWQFNTLIPLPGELALYNEKKEYIGNVLNRQRYFISRRNVGSDDWTIVSVGSHVGRVLRLQILLANRSLPAGVYYIQLILYKAFISANPFQMVDEPTDIYKHLQGGELCRSNVVKIEVVDR
jgi:hypothetical protein